MFYSVRKGVLGTLQLKAANLRTYEYIIERLKDLLVDSHMARALSGELKSPMWSFHIHAVQKTGV